jgi:hypothetical protein
MEASDTAASGKALITIHAFTRDRLHSLTAFVISSVCTFGEELQRDRFILASTFTAYGLRIKAFFFWQKTH